MPTSEDGVGKLDSDSWEYQMLNLEEKGRIVRMVISMVVWLLMPMVVMLEVYLIPGIVQCQEEGEVLCRWWRLGEMYNVKSVWKSA